MSEKGNFAHNKYGCEEGETLNDSSLIKLIDHDYQNNSHIILCDSTSENVEYINSIQDGFQQSEILCSFVCDTGLNSDDLPLETSSLEIESIQDSDSHIKFPDSPANAYSNKIESIFSVDGLDEQIDTFLLTDFQKVNKQSSEEGVNSLEEEQRNVTDTISAIAKSFGLEDLLPETFQMDGKLMQENYEIHEKLLSSTSDSGCENEIEKIEPISLEDCSALHSPSASIDLGDAQSLELVAGLDMITSPPHSSLKSVKLKEPVKKQSTLTEEPSKLFNTSIKDMIPPKSGLLVPKSEPIEKNKHSTSSVKTKLNEAVSKPTCVEENVVEVSHFVPDTCEEIIPDYVPTVRITDIDTDCSDLNCASAGHVLITHEKGSKKMQIVLTLEQGQQIYDIETESFGVTDEALNLDLQTSISENAFHNIGNNVIEILEDDDEDDNDEELIECATELESEKSNDMGEEDDFEYLPPTFVELVSDASHSVPKGRRSKTWVCPIEGCGQLLDKECKLRVHMISHKGGSRPFKCEFEGCDWAFTTPYRLRRHAETHLGSKDYICDFEGCNRKFTTVYNLKTHIKRHKWPNSLTCPSKDCKMSFANRRKLELHLRVHKDVEAPYKCDLCGKQYYSANCIASHYRTHQYNEDDFKCPFQGCGKVYDKICRLRQHIRHHTGDRPYACPAEGCKWSFMSASKLTRHMRKHTGERKFMCTEPGCGKSFMRPEHLKGHIVIHSGDKPFHCPHENCNAKFTAKSSLYVHVKKHCPSVLKVVYPCPASSCVKKYNSKATLKQHLQKFHPDEYGEGKELNIAEKLELTMPVSLVNQNSENSTGYLEFEDAMADDPSTDLKFQLFPSVNSVSPSFDSYSLAMDHDKSGIIRNLTKAVPKTSKSGTQNSHAGNKSQSSKKKVSDKLFQQHTGGCARTDYCCKTSSAQVQVESPSPLNFVTINQNSIDTHDAKNFTEIRSPDVMLTSSIIFQDQNSEPLMKSNFLQDDCSTTHSFYHEDSILVSGSSFESELIPSSLLSDDVDSDNSVLNHTGVFSEQNSVEVFAESILLE